MSEIEILDDSFEPKNVHDIFMDITKLSHPSKDPSHSGDENPLRSYIVDFARKNNVEVAFYKEDATEPGERVIVLRRKGSGAYKNFITLQAHTDMVCYPDEKIFPLHVFGYRYKGKDEKWIKAGDEKSTEDPSIGTTLGADDGIGVATILAILLEDNLKKYPLECFFTVQEETNMGGAKDFDPKILKGKKYINLDAEVLKTIIYGSAGGCHVQFSGTVSRTSLPAGYLTLKVELTGLRSGHSGVNINNGRLNAIKALADVLCRLNNRLNNLDITGDGIHSYDLRLVSIKRDEESIMNKIPGRACAEIAVPNWQEPGIVQDFNAYCEAMKIQGQPEEDLIYKIVPEQDSPSQALDEASTDAVLGLLRLIPHGAIRMIPSNPSLVETSSNLAAIDIDAGNGVIIQSSNRSSNDKSMESLTAMQKSIGDMFGFKVSFDGFYPSWQPKENSKLLALAKDVYKKLYNEDFKATVIHAGLECSYIAEKYGERMECISIEPTIDNPHMGGERLQASTVHNFYEAVVELIERIFMK